MSTGSDLYFGYDAIGSMSTMTKKCWTGSALRYKVSAVHESMSLVCVRKLMSMLKKQTLDGNVETLLLGILCRRPNYGYRIVQELNELAPEVLKMGEGTVYPVLHRMERRGLLTSRWESAEECRPRKYYSVSKKGKRQLVAAQQQWNALQLLMDSVFAGHALTHPKPIAKGAQ